MAAIQFKPVGPPETTGKTGEAGYTCEQTSVANVKDGQIVRVVTEKRLQDGSCGLVSDATFIPQKL